MIRCIRVICVPLTRNVKMSDELLHKDVTDRIIKAFYTVYNTLSYGFLERVYENALVIELNNIELNIERQCPLKVFYHQNIVGEFFADLVIDQKVIVELKATETINQSHITQLQNYLKAIQMKWDCF
jgi:GxxExxY protein